MLAGELALAGVDVAIVERRANQDVPGRRAGGLHARAIEIMDQRGIADRFLSQGQIVQANGFGWIRFDISDFPSRHPYSVALPQDRIERILADWVGELAVPTYRGREVTGFAQDETGVDIAVSTGPSLRAEYLVGCDGGRSVVRKVAGIAFTGCDPTTSWLIAEIDTKEEPAWGLRHDARGIHGFSKIPTGVGVVVTEPRLETGAEPTLEDLSEALIAVWGSDYGAHSPMMISRFTDATRQAVAYRDRRVLLAGDAAHVHNPVGGQGLNTGVQDAMNLGWKLGQVIKGTSPESLLDTYHAERYPVGARVLHNTLAQVALLRQDDRTKALHQVMADLLKLDAPRRLLGGMMSGLDIHYDLGEGHPLLGRRMPDLDLITADGPVRVYSLLHKAQPVMLNFGEPGGPTYDGAWELPVIGTIPAPAAVSVRPDGYVDWVKKE